MKGLRGGLAEEPATTFDASAHAFFVPGTIPGAEESIALAVPWPSDETLTLVYARSAMACRGTTAGAWRLTDERDVRDLRTTHATLVARSGDCPVDSVPLIALRGVVPADVEFVPAESHGLEPASLSSALRRAQGPDASAVSLDTAFHVRGRAYAAVLVRMTGDTVARRFLVPLGLEWDRRVAPVSKRDGAAR